LTKSALLCAVVVLALALGIAAASASDTHVTAHVCGVNGCADLPSTLAVQLSQRDDSFSPRSKPKPLPYYKIMFKTDGTEGYVNGVIIWVPSKHLFRTWYDVFPKLSANWRTGNKAYETQFMQAVRAGALRPFPASRHYK
jgi:hypothetical protein